MYTVHALATLTVPSRSRGADYRFDRDGRGHGAAVGTGGSFYIQLGEISLVLCILFQLDGTNGQVFAGGHVALHAGRVVDAERNALRRDVLVEAVLFDAAGLLLRTGVAPAYLLHLPGQTRVIQHATGIRRGLNAEALGETNRHTRLEPFSGVEIHMEMDMEWKWMEMGHNL